MNRVLTIPLLGLVASLTACNGGWFPTSSATPGATASNFNPIAGQVVDESGRGIPGVALFAHMEAMMPVPGALPLTQLSPYLLAIAGSSNRRIAAGATDVTDGEGRFKLFPASFSGTFALEATEPAGRKAWRGGVAWGVPGPRVDVGQMVLTSPGGISGQLVASGSASVDLSPCWVMIPHSDYRTQADRDGGFHLAGVPAGNFTVGFDVTGVAGGTYRPEPSTVSVSVLSGQTATLSPIALIAKP